jgi:hypothetical protein
MTKNHYFPDTSFFLNNPNFDQYLFDLKPYKLVVCKTVMVELDRMKTLNNSGVKVQIDKGFKSREASRTFEALQKRKLSLLNEGELEFLKKTSHDTQLNSDERILYALGKYANQHRGEGKIIFLSYDRNQRIAAREPDCIYTVADPIKWENMQKEDRQYLETLGGVVNKDERVKQAYEEKISLEFELAEMEFHASLAELEALTDRVEEARQKEKQEMERYIAEQLVIKDKEERQFRLKNRNKYQFTLSEFLYKNEIKRPVRDPNFRQIGEINIGKRWMYLEYPGKFSMVHIYGKIGSEYSEGIMISANRTMPRQFGREGLVSAPINQRFVLRTEEWKIIVDVFATISPATYPPPPGVPGEYSVFDIMNISIDVEEMSADEVAEYFCQKEEKEMKRRIILQPG